MAFGAGAGTVALLRGELEASLGGNLDQTNGAVNRAIEELKFVRFSETKDALLALTVVRKVADHRLTVRQDVVGEKLTRVRIRVGVFGDEKLSRTLLDRIQAKLLPAAGGCAGSVAVIGGCKSRGFPEADGFNPHVEEPVCEAAG